MLDSPEAHRIGKIFRCLTPLESPAISSSWDKAPFSKKVSISASSTSATTSMSLSRASVAASASSAGTSVTL